MVVTTTPSARLIAAGQEAVEVTDACGRQLRLRRMTALDKLRLFKAAGSVLVQNQVWLGMALLASTVIGVDDVPVPTPTSEAQIEALVQLLGDAGIMAVATALEPSSAHVDPDVAKN